MDRCSRASGDFARFRARAAAEYIDFAPALAHYGEMAIPDAIK